MKVCYNKLWKLLIDKGMKKSQLRVAVGASKSTFAKLGTFVSQCRSFAGGYATRL